MCLIKCHLWGSIAERWNLLSILIHVRRFVRGTLTLLHTYAVSCVFKRQNLFEVAVFYVSYVVWSWDTVVPPPWTGSLTTIVIRSSHSEHFIQECVKTINEYIWCKNQICRQNSLYKYFFHSKVIQIFVCIYKAKCTGCSNLLHVASKRQQKICKPSQLL